MSSFQPICVPKGCELTEFFAELTKFGALKSVSSLPQTALSKQYSAYFKGRLTGGFQTGGLPDLDLSFLFCPFFCPFWDFPGFSGIFPICSGMVRGFSRFVPFLFLSLLRALTRNSPENTIWTFPEKMGNPPVWNPPGLASLKYFSHCEGAEDGNLAKSVWE